ncbi:MAG: TonB-dependent receptor [Acidobacteria bacterium]|nr:TonB-dependent receptor [Acidobacteriota bacterium]
MKSVYRIAVAMLMLALPALALAQQGSTISGTVRDTSGAVLPGVTVEVSSPALIEKTRSAVTDGEGKYSIVQLRPGTYSVVFSLPGFSTVKRENLELTSDFTATVNADMRVGGVEETITVAAQSPIVDVQSITQRTVMTRDVLDSVPTGRNIQAVGIMIPGTSIAAGGGGALSRDVGGSGGMQQSPLQYRGSGDTVQTIEGIRLNNLCAQGAYSGVYWNDGSFQELSYVTGADSAEMGQGGIRVNMVPKDGGNAFKGTVFGNWAGEAWTANNLRTNLAGDLTYNQNNRLTNVGNIQKVWDLNPSIGGPIKKDRIWFNYTFRSWGVYKYVADSYFDKDASPFVYVADTSRPGIDDGYIFSNVGRIAAQATSKDKVSVYFDKQQKYRNHWGIAANVPPEAAGVQVTPSNYVGVGKWTRTQSSRLLFEGGFGIYNQNYTELYQKSVTGVDPTEFNLDAIRNARVYTVLDQSTGKIANAWNAPQTSFSTLRTWMAAASYVTGSHSFRFGASLTNGDWRRIRAFSGDTSAITYNAGVPVQVVLQLPWDRRNGIKADTGIYAQDRWSLGRVTLNLGVRYDWFLGETQKSEVLASQNSPGFVFDTCPDGLNNPAAGCVGRVQNWKDISPRVGFAWDVFGNGKTAIKASAARYVNGQTIAVADDINPVSALSLSDTRPWKDLDNNGLPYDANGNLQFNELSASTSTPTFGKRVSTTRYDPEVLNGWFKRAYNVEYTFAAQHQLRDGLSVNGGWYRRSFGNTTFTDDLRFNLSSYDGPFCMTAPTNANLPNGGGYQVCGIYNLKPSVFAQNLPADNLVTFADKYDYKNVYQGIDVNMDWRLPKGAFIRGGINMQKRQFNNCGLITGAGPDAVVGTTFLGTEEYPADGSRYCDRTYGYRPDAKLMGSYTLPLDIQFSATYQFTRGVQTGGAGPSLQANWAVTNAVINPFIGGNWTGAASRTVQLMREGLDYGKDNLNQIDLRASKRFRMGHARMRVDLDLYNVTNSNWAYTRNSTFSTAATSAWLRPTNVLQSRFFKIGASLDF